MKKFFVYFALFIAALFVVSCGESEDGDGTSDGSCTAGQYKCDGQALKVCGSNGFWTLKEDCTASGQTCNANQGACTSGGSSSSDNGAGIHLGIIGFNYKLTEMGIRLLSNASDFTSFIDSLNRENNTALYYADDMALERMKEYNKPPKLEHVALVTFTDGIDNQSIADGLKPEYDTPDAYLDDLSKKIHNEKIHGLSVESYTIGLRTADDMDSSLKPKFDAMLNKLASTDSYAFPVDNMNEVKKHFADIANSLVQVSRSINYGVYMPSGYPSGKIRYTFDNAQSADSSELYIEANYNKGTTTLENVTYHGFKTGATTIKAQPGIKGALFYRFDDLRYSDGSSVSEGMSFALWQQIEGKWKSETEITPEDYPPEVTKDMSSALIMLVLDCTTSLKEDNFIIMKDAAKEFVRTLANAGGNGGNGGGNNTDPTEPTTDPTNQGGGAKEACYEIYECFAQCQDNECAQACLDAGDPAGQDLFMDMYTCWSNNCANETTNEGFSNCVVNNCYDETDACGLMGGGGGEDADTSYNSPYGSLSLQFSVDQIWNESDGQQSEVGTTQTAFASGTYGNASASVTPADAYMIQTSAMYNSDAQYGNSVALQQVPVYVQGNQGVGGNPVVILSIDEENAAVGSLKTSLYQGAQATLYVVDVNWSTGQLSCFHAFGEGTVNVTNIGDIANHGALALNGNVTLYSPKNYDGNGDISSQLGVTVCAPKY